MSEWLKSSVQMPHENGDEKITYQEISAQEIVSTFNEWIKNPEFKRKFTQAMEKFNDETR